VGATKISELIGSKPIQQNKLITERTINEIFDFIELVGYATIYPSLIITDLNNPFITINI
jgi:hypothetical protein